jgi:hypothetical protein
VRRAFVTSLLAALLAPATARAQTDGLTIRALRRDPITATSTVTAVFMVNNTRPDTVDVMPHVDIPKDWTVLLGGSSFQSYSGSSMLVLSFAVPSRFTAGTYPVRVWLTTRTDVKGTMDSVVVVVPPKRAIDVVLTDRPGYAVSGNTYEVGIQVRNRGNTNSSLRVDVRSSLGAASNADSTFDLGPEESRSLRVRVRTPAGLSEAADDVLEIMGRVLGDTSTADASARITVVPEPTRKIEEFLRVPVQANVRAASASGVSPYEIFGSGYVIDGKPVRLDFLARGAPGHLSTFGERDEYRAELSSKSWRLRAGDHVFMLSSLTGSAQPGVGVGADAERGRFSFGAYSQQFRHQRELRSAVDSTEIHPLESGAFLGASLFDGANVSFNALNRTGGGTAGGIGSVTASVTRENVSAEGEIARSKNGSNTGSASSVRVSGSSSWASYDAGHLFADTAFTGSQRGASHDYVTARTSYFEHVSLSVNASTHRTDLSRSTGVPYTERFDFGGVNATVFNRISVEMGGAMRSTRTAGVTQSSKQQSLRARGDQALVFGTISVEGELGRSAQPLVATQTFTDVSLGVRRPLRSGSMSGYVSRYSGGAVTKGASASVSLGGDFTTRIRSSTDMTVMGYAIRQRAAVSEWHTQIDAQVAHRLANGNSLRLRARILGGGSVPTANQSVAYLEYSVPMRLPVSRLRTTGRVYGHVVDAVSGKGVPNALVRLGPQVAITDKEGKVSFGGVPGGEHRLSMSQETSFTDAVFVGDPTLDVDSTRTQPTTFKLAIARGARVEVDVRRFAVSRTAVNGGADSLAEAGAVANATLVLTSGRDTLYRTTNDNGTATFTDVPPGDWHIAIRGDAPAFHRFDPDRADLTLAPGESRQLSFRLIPRRREVQVIGGDQELRPTTADPKTQTGPGVRVIKPNEMRPNQDQQKQQ